jgi:hypothetical protein
MLREFINDCRIRGGRAEGVSDAGRPIHRASSRVFHASDAIECLEEPVPERFAEP